MKSAITILVSDNAWRAACVCDGGVAVEPIDYPADADLETKAIACADWIRSRGASESVVLALPSSWCLCASIPTDALGRGPRRKAMGYLLEEHLPLSAEDSVSDYIERDGHAWGVCVELARLRPLIDAMEAAGVRVAHAVPLSLLAAQYVVRDHSDCDAVWIASPDHSEGNDLIELDSGRPARWSWRFDDQTAWFGRRESMGDPPGRPPRVIRLTRDTGDAEENGLAGVAADPITSCDRPAEQAAALFAAGLLVGTGSPWIELRRGALAAPGRYQQYRKPLGLLVASAAFLLICVVFSTYWLGRRYAQMADDYGHRQEEIFRGVMPGQRPPASIAHRLASEQRKLAGLGGQAFVASSEDAEALHPLPALSQLYTVLGALPDELRFVVTDLRIEPEQVRVEGRAQSHLVAERLAGAIRNAPDAAIAYEVDPPNSYQDERLTGVRFDFVARPMSAETGTSEARP